MNKAKIKHYAYIVVAAGLLFVSLVNIIANVGRGVAEANYVTITSPAVGQEVQDSDTKIKGTAPALKEVVVYDGAKKVGETTALANGTWSIDWKKLKPGEHNLKAYIVDGDLYRGDVLSSNSVKGFNLNTGQVNKNFSAGFSGSSVSVYDSSSDETFVVNALSGTVSTINAETNEVTDNFVYRSENVLPAAINELPVTYCTGESTWFTCAYTYDEENNLLYMLEGDSVYVINTENGSTESVIEDIQILEEDSSSLRYSLYLDPAKQSLYVYHQSKSNSGNVVQRIDVGTNTLSESFSLQANSLVATVNGDLYYGETDSDLKYITNNDPGTAQSIDISTSGCDSEISNLAMSVDQSRLYAECEAAGTGKVVIINTSDKQTVGAFDRNGPMLNSGNLKTDKLLLSGYENVSDTDLIDVYNTSSQISEQSIYPIEGRVLPSSLVIEQDRIVFNTVDTDNALNRVYVVDSSSSSNTILDAHEYSYTDFYGMKSAVMHDTNKIMFLPFFSGDTIGVIDIGTGDLEAAVNDGMGAAGEVEFSKSSNRVFAIGSPLPLTLSTSVNVADATSGDYEGTVNIPGHVPVSIAMNEDGSRLYVLAMNMIGFDDVKIFAIDTQALEVVDTYDSISDVFDGLNDLLFAYRVDVKDDRLSFTNGQDIFVVDLINDSVQSKSLSEDSAQSYTSDAILGMSALSPDGSKLAVLAEQEIPDNDETGDTDQVIKIYNTSDLSLVKDIFTGARDSAFIYTSINFDDQGNLYALKSSPYLALVKPTLDLVNIDNGDIEIAVPAVQPSNSGSINGLASLCIGADIDFDQSGNYALLNYHCFEVYSQSSDPDNLIGYKNSSVPVDIEGGRALTTKSSQTKEINILNFYNLLNSSSPDFNVVSAERQVDVVASKISITSPSNNSEIKKGSRKIKGTAPPNKTLSIKVDNKSIGAAESDEFGIWEKTYNFSQTKSFKIKAEIVQPNEDVAYSTLLNVENIINEQSFAGSVGVIGLEQDDIIDEFDLPAPYIPFMPIVRGSSIYTLAVDPASPSSSLRSYKLNRTTGAVQKSVNLAATSIDSLGGFMFSEDASKLYLMSKTDDPENDPDEENMNIELNIFSTSSGAIEKTIDFEMPTMSNEYAPFNFYGNMVYVDSLDVLAFVYPNGQGSGVIDLDSEEVVLNSFPENSGISISSVVYDKQTNKIYSATNDNNDPQSPKVYVAKVDPEQAFSNPEYQPEWTTALEGYYLNPKTAFSVENQTLVFTGVEASENPYEAGFVLLEVDADDGSYDTEYFQPSDEFTSTVANASAFGGILPMGYDIVGNKLFGSMIYIGGSGFIGGSVFYTLPLDGSGDPDFTILENTLMYQASIDSFATNKGDVLSAENLTKVIDDDSVSNELCPYDSSILKDDPNCVETKVTKKPCPYNSLIEIDDPNCIDTPVDPFVLEPEDEDEEPKNTEQENLGPVAVNNSNGTGSSAIEEQVEETLKLSALDKALLAVKAFATSVPAPIVYAFPYLMYTVLLAIAINYLYQTQKHFRQESRLRKLFDKQKVIVEEKTNFLELASHYLRTPLTYIRSGSEMAIHKGTTEQTGKNLTNSVERLALFIESLIEELDRNKDLKEISAPQPTKSALLTIKFWLPALGMIVILGLFYLVFKVVGGMEFANTEYVTHILAVFLIVQLLYGMITNRQRVIREEKQLEQIVAAEKTLDEARTKLMKDAGIQLKTRTYELLPIINQLDPSASASKSVMQQGVARLQELATAFLMVGKLEASKLTSDVESVSVTQIANNVIESMTTIIDKKKILVNLEGFSDEVNISTNKPLIELVLKSLINNAVNASDEGGTIILKCISSGGRVAFQVIDSGAGIAEDKIDRLFKPFVRVGPVTTFNNEGMGLSLYLDRLIMHTLGGEISLTSKPNKGTVAIVNL